METIHATSEPRARWPEFQPAAKLNQRNGLPLAPARRRWVLFGLIVAGALALGIITTSAIVGFAWQQQRERAIAAARQERAAQRAVEVAVPPTGFGLSDRRR